MRAYLLSLGLLVMLAFSLATKLEPWFQTWAGNRATSANLLQVALGDSRRLFAKHFFVKADAYFHNGYYPTIYDNKEDYTKVHIAEDMHEAAEEEKAANFLGKPRDWIDAFSRNFYPTRHTHLGDAGCNDKCCEQAKEHKGHDHEAAEAGGAEREILPWLWLSVELDPQRVETYVVTSYWLCRSLNKVSDAEAFLRVGLRNNPGNSEILFELGRLYHKERKDDRRARNVLEIALTNWHKREDGKPEPNRFLQAQILNHLALIETTAENFDKATGYYRELLLISPHKDSVAQRIKESEEAAAAKRKPSAPVEQ